jgi:hypothetical protein
MVLGHGFVIKKKKTELKLLWQKFESLPLIANNDIYNLGS